ncbi:MAG: amidohydrolase family protein [Halobacteriales archaeon]|nr:amidohydrolase family protein [Halobacteriales archaeon]
MADDYDLLVEDAYLHDRDATVDIGVRDGHIVDVTETIDGTAVDTIDADGNLVSPGFVDAHKHLDRGLAATDGRRPQGNVDPMTHRSYMELFDEYYERLSHDELVDRIVENIEMAVAAGTTHIRSHVTVDHSIGTGTMDACLEAADRVDDIVDIELAPSAARGLLRAGAEDAVREAIESAPDDMPVFVGGSESGRGIRERAKEFERWFEIATDYDIGVDVHVSSRESLGIESLAEIAALTEEYDYGGRVSVIHAYALAMIPDWWVEEIAGTLRDAGVNVITCFNSTRSSMPIKEFIGEGATLAHGTDNDRDFVVPHGNADSLEAAQILSFKLNYGPDTHRPTRDYRWYDTNEALTLLWEVMTEQGATALGLDGYGIAEGNHADFVVFDAPSPEWAIIDQSARSHVVKDGQVVAEDGTVVAID